MGGLLQSCCRVALGAGGSPHLSGTEAPLNVQQDESFSRVLFCDVLLSVASAVRCWRSLWVCRAKLAGSTD